MSTKIYNGFRFKKINTLKDIHSFCHKLRDKVKPIAEEQYQKLFISEMVDTYDKNQFGYLEEPMYFIKHKSSAGDLFWGVESYLNARIRNIEITQERDPEVDFGFSISIIPLQKKKDVLVLLYAEKKELYSAFKKMREVEDYHYQNQSDRPKNISQKKWDERLEDWNDALGGDGWSTPLECGFTYEPYDVRRLSFFYLKENGKKILMKYMPSIENRATVIAKLQRGTEWDIKNPLNSVLPENPTREQTNKQHDLRMDQYWKFDKYTQTDEGKKELAEKIEIIRPQLKIFNEFKDINTQIVFHEKIEKILSEPNGGKPYWYNRK